MRRSARRLAAAGGPLGALLQRWDNAMEALAAAQLQTRGTLTAGDAPETAQRARQQTMITARLDELRALDQELAHHYVSAAALIRPGSVDAAAVRGVLSPEEALLIPLADEAGTILWVVTRERTQALLLPPTAQTLAELVRDVRRGVDFDAVPEGGRLPPFDLAAAKQLFAALIAPARGVMGERTDLVWVPYGPLQALSPHLLVTDDADARWMGTRFAVTVTPSADALVAARTQEERAVAPPKFLGIGDPTHGAPVLASAEATHGDVLRNALLGLPPLPETRLELTRMAGLFPPSEVTLLLGDDAQKAAVANALSRTYDVVTFATHAVMAGELPGLYEPAVVLSAPSEATDDWLMTASELAASHMDAELVILSACSTASGGGGPFAEGLSGLARAFFHAGARNLLVSHWSVASRHTVELTPSFLDTLRMHPGMTQARALQATIGKLLGSGDPELAHPAVWASFVVVGR